MPGMKQGQNRSAAWRGIVPKTAESLLAAIADPGDHARWGEFVARYTPMMRMYLARRFPAADAEDIIQETFISLVKAIPRYTYVPEEKGHFRSYLTGILHHKAANAVECDIRRRKAECAHTEEEHRERREEKGWRRSAMEIALQQLLADESMQPRTREVFRRVAVNGEKPAEVAESFGVSLNAIYQMKDRAKRRLKELVAALEAAVEA